MRYGNWRNQTNIAAFDTKRYKIFTITNDKVRMHVVNTWGQIRQHVEQVDAYLILLGDEMYDQCGDEAELSKLDAHLDELYYDTQERI